VCVPFLMTNPHSLDISLTAYNQTFQAPWVGTVELDQAGKWFDDFMLLVSGVGEAIIRKPDKMICRLEHSLCSSCITLVVTTVQLN